MTPEISGRVPRRGHRLLRGLRAQLLLWTILPLAVVLIVLSLAGVTRHRQAMTRLVEDRDRGVTVAQANRLGREVAKQVAVLARLAATLPTAELPATLADQPLDAVGSFTGGLAWLNNRGTFVAASPVASAWAKSDTVRLLAARAAAVGQTQYDTDLPSNDAARLLIAVPASDGKVLVGALPVEALNLAESNLLLEGEMQGAMFVLDQTGRRVHHHDPANLAVDPAVLPLLLLFVAVVALLAVSFGVLSVVRPLQELDRRAARVAWGDFEAVEQPVGGVQEIDDLRVTLAQMAERIRDYQSGMRDYLSAITQGQEEERGRLAHELHDVSIQGLIALKQRGQMALKTLGRDPARAEAHLQELNSLIDEEVAGLRRIIGDLRPIYLDDLGFVPALEMLSRQTEERHGLCVHLTERGQVVRLAPDLELAAYRIAQQALANVAAHAQARNAWLDVIFDSDHLTLVIRDDGVGFTPPEQPADLAHQGHFGLMGMHERVLLYGGQLTIASVPGQGTTITARLPLLH